MAPGPQQFGKYSLTRRLAFGGMAEIFLASLKGTQGFQKKVVLKRILPQYGTDPQFVGMFIDEAVIAARLTHPNIVQVYDFGDVDDVYFIAMEFVDGADLRQVVRSAADQGAPLTPAEVAAMGEGICAGLSYAHNFTDDDGQSLNIVHRDISPHNIMVSRSGEAKVMDFGIAKAEARATKTATGTIKGKVAYMAPEQARGEPIDKRCDQFAVGLVLWEALTGERVFQGDSDLEMLRLVVACETRPPSELRADIPPELDAVIMRALQRDRDDRYADLAEMQQELAKFRFSLGTEGAVQVGATVDRLVPKRSTSAQRPATKQLPAAGAEESGVPDPSISETSAERPARDSWDDSAAHTAVTASDSGSAGSEVAGEAPTRVLRSDADPRAGQPAQKPPWLWLGLGAIVSALVVVVVILIGRSTETPTEVVEVPVASPTTALTITSEPPGAKIVLGGAETGLGTPATLPDQVRGHRLAVELRLDGYQPWAETIALVQAQQTVSATLNAASPQPQGTGSPPESERPVVADAGPSVRNKNRRPPRASPKPAGEGFVSLRSSGAWVEVYHKGRKLGTTPLRRAKVPAGKVKLKLVNRDEGIEDWVTFQVDDGEEIKKAVHPK